MKHRTTTASTQSNPEHSLEQDNLQRHCNQSNDNTRVTQLDHDILISEEPERARLNPQEEPDYERSDSAFSMDEAERTYFADWDGSDDAQATLRAEVDEMNRECIDRDNVRFDYQLSPRSPLPLVHFDSTPKTAQKRQASPGSVTPLLTGLGHRTSKDAFSSQPIVVKGYPSTTQIDQQHIPHMSVIASPDLENLTMKIQSVEAPFEHEGKNHRQAQQSTEHEEFLSTEDNDFEDFSGVTIAQLQDQPIDPIISANASARATTQAPPDDALCRRLEHISKIRNPETRAQQHEEFFGSLDLDDFSRCAGLISAKLCHVITELDRIRQEKRKLMIYFQVEIAEQECISRAHDDTISTRLVHLKQSGETVLRTGQ